MISSVDFYRSAADDDAFERSAPRGPFTVEQLRVDTHVGDGELKKYWLHGPGLKKWATKPHPWTALFKQLCRHMNPEKAKRVASQWYHDHFGHWVGEKKGKNPVGKG